MRTPRNLFLLAGLGVVVVVATFCLFLLTSFPSAFVVPLLGVGFGAAIYGTIMGVITLRERRAGPTT